MKKRFIIVAALALSLVFSAQVFAATPNKPTIFENFNLVYDGEMKTFEKNAPVLNLNGRTMLPLAYMFDMVNTDKSGTISWDAKERMVTMINKGTTIKLWIGKSEAEVNGKKVPVGDASPIIYNDRTYVPMSFVGTNFDLAINWDQNSRTAFVGQNATLNQIADILTKADAEYKKVTKFSYNDMHLTEYEMNVAGDTVELSFITKSKLEEDKLAYFCYMVTEYLYSWGVEKVESYDDGVNEYIIDGTDIYKEESGKEFDLKTGLYTDIANDRKNLYGLSLETSQDGNYIISGYVNSAYEPFYLYLNSYNEGIRFTLEEMSKGGKVEQTYITPPFATYKINKTTGMLMEVAVSNGIGFNIEFDGKDTTVDAVFSSYITDFTPNITLDKTIPDYVKKNAKEAE